jgi:hypothetical protein
MLEKESTTFNEKLSELLKTDINKFVLIKEDKIIGTFTAIDDALNYGYEKYREQPFFVREILPLQQPLNFSNNYLFC